MSNTSPSFGPNKSLAVIPALFMGSFLIVFLLGNDFVWGWGFLLGSGVLSSLAFLAQWRVYRFEEHQMFITGPFSTRIVPLTEIQSHQRKTLTRRGIHYYTWTLEIKNKRKLIILSDYMKDVPGFRKALEIWLTSAD